MAANRSVTPIPMPEAFALPGVFLICVSIYFATWVQSRKPELNHPQTELARLTRQARWLEGGWNWRSRKTGTSTWSCAWRRNVKRRRSGSRNCSRRAPEKRLSAGGIAIPFLSF